MLIRRDTKNISLITKYPAATTSVNRGHVEAVALCPGSKGYWTETNLTRFDEGARNSGKEFFINRYAYPLNTIGKQERIKELLEHTSSNGIIGLGRWGEWQHFNSDVVMRRAMDMAQKMI